MSRPWLEELEALTQRFGVGLGVDLAGLALTDLWGVYRFLCGIAEGAG